jgi:hypothetical protein
MRGVPNNPVKCIGCGRMNGCLRDRLCHSCRIRSRPPARRKFVWTVELDNSLRREYTNAHSRAELSANLDQLQRNTGFTRNVILERAVQLGLGFSVRRPWTTPDLRVLDDAAGQVTPKALAAKLNRTYGSVKAKMKERRLSARVSEGYTEDDLRQLLGVSVRSVGKWLSMGWLRTAQGRITEASVVKFLKFHSEEYHLGRVDQAWFKGLLFPAFNFSTARLESVKHAASRGPIANPRTDLQRPFVTLEFSPETELHETERTLERRT